MMSKEGRPKDNNNDGDDDGSRGRYEPVDSINNGIMCGSTAKKNEEEGFGAIPASTTTTINNTPPALGRMTEAFSTNNNINSSSSSRRRSDGELPSGAASAAAVESETQRQHQHQQQQQQKKEEKERNDSSGEFAQTINVKTLSTTNQDQNDSGIETSRLDKNNNNSSESAPAQHHDQTTINCHVSSGSGAESGEQAGKDEMNEVKARMKKERVTTLVQHETNRSSLFLKADHHQQQQQQQQHLPVVPSSGGLMMMGMMGMGEKNLLHPSCRPKWEEHSDPDSEDGGGSTPQCRSKDARSVSSSSIVEGYPEDDIIKAKSSFFSSTKWKSSSTSSTATMERSSSSSSSRAVQQMQQEDPDNGDNTNHTGTPSPPTDSQNPLRDTRQRSFTRRNMTRSRSHRSAGAGARSNNTSFLSRYHNRNDSTRQMDRALRESMSYLPGAHNVAGPSWSYTFHPRSQHNENSILSSSDNDGSATVDSTSTDRFLSAEAILPLNNNNPNNHHHINHGSARHIISTADVLQPEFVSCTHFYDDEVIEGTIVPDRPSQRRRRRRSHYRHRRTSSARLRRRLHLFKRKPYSQILCVGLITLIAFIVAAIVASIHFTKTSRQQKQQQQPDSTDINDTNGGGGDIPDNQKKIPLAPPDMASNRYKNLFWVLVPSHPHPYSLMEIGSAQESALHWLADFDKASISTDDTFRLRQRYALATLYFATNDIPMIYQSVMTSSSTMVAYKNEEEGGTRRRQQQQQPQQPQPQMTTNTINTTGGNNNNNKTKKKHLSWWTHDFHFLSEQHECQWTALVPIGGSPGVFVNDFPKKPGEGGGSSDIQKWTQKQEEQVDGPYERQRRRRTTNNNNNNQSSSDEMIQMGVICDSNSNIVTELILNQNNLTGSIPDEMYQLQNLTSIELWANKLTGTISSYLGNLTSLTYVDFGLNTKLNGTIPSTIGYLSSLEQFHCAKNSLSGNIPTQLGQLTRLIGIGLSGNKLTGPLPPSISNLTQLISFQVNFNRLTGPIPDGVRHLEKLVVLNLGNNRMNGTWIMERGNYPSLAHFNILNNQFTGTISNHIGSLSTSLKKMAIGRNDFHGTLPDSIHNLRLLKSLIVSNNRLSGTIPKSWNSFNLPNLEWLYLGDNLLEGSIPMELFETTTTTTSATTKTTTSNSLGILSLEGNNLNGTIPKTIQNLPNLFILSLHSNELSGSIPSEISTNPNLWSVELSYNKLIGTIPSSIQNLTKLAFFSSTGNSLTPNYNDLCPNNNNNNDAKIFVDCTTTSNKNNNNYCNEIKCCENSNLFDSCYPELDTFKAMHMACVPYAQTLLIERPRDLLFEKDCNQQIVLDFYLSQRKK